MDAKEREEIRETERLYLRTLGAECRRERVEGRETKTRKPCRIVFTYSQN